MYSSSLHVKRAHSLDEAVALLVEARGKAMVVAGGTGLMPFLKSSTKEPELLVDIKGIDEMSVIRDAGDSILIGALSTYAQLMSSDLIKRVCPLIAEAAASIDDTEVCQHGTVGGSMVRPVPGLDLPAVVLALDGELHVIGPKGPRQISARAFFTASDSERLAPDEILTATKIVKSSSVTGSAYVKLKNPAAWCPLLGVAAVVGLAYDGATRRFWGLEYKTCEWVRLAVMSAWTGPCLATGAAEVLEGMLIDESTTSAAAERVADTLGWSPGTDRETGIRDRALKPYVRRALLRSAERARAAQ